MPPAAFNCSIYSSAAALAGTPNTDAGPDKKVVMPTFNSAGLLCASAPVIPSAEIVSAVAAITERESEDIFICILRRVNKKLMVELV